MLNNEIIDSKGLFSLSINDIQEIENLIGTSLEEPYRLFLLEYGDTFLKDCYFQNNDVYACPSYICGKSNMNPSIFKLIEGNIFYEFEYYLPFAIDHGGWVFNISLKKNDSYGEIWINRFDSGEENPFKLVCKSLDKFLRELKLSD